jgi:6-phosphogluconolactonase
MTTINVYKDKDEVSLAAAELIAHTVRQAVQSRGRCNVVLAGGETPRRAYELLAASPYGVALPWQQIHVYWGDERCVPSTDALSNQHMVRQALLGHVPIPEENIHPISYEGAPMEAAQNYEKLLRTTVDNEMPQFDLVLLGLGNDGHTASLFPHTDVLNSHKQWVSPVYLPEKDQYRITVTAPILNGARIIVFLVVGENKAQVVQEIIEGPMDKKRLPAQLISPLGGSLYWLLDEKAAALLSHKSYK